MSEGCINTKGNKHLQHTIYREEYKEMRQKLKTKKGKKKYAKRMQSVKPVFGSLQQYYGLSATMKKYKDCIDEKLLNNDSSIVALFRLLHAILKLAPYTCEECQSCNYDINGIKKDATWIFYYITLPNLRGPPQAKAHKTKRA